MKRAPYVRIMKAAKRGRGVHLTADEVFAMSLDDAIMTRAVYILDGAPERLKPYIVVKTVEKEERDEPQKVMISRWSDEAREAAIRARTQADAPAPAQPVEEAGK